MATVSAQKNQPRKEPRTGIPADVVAAVRKAGWSLRRLSLEHGYHEGSLQEGARASLAARGANIAAGDRPSPACDLADALPRRRHAQERPRRARHRTTEVEGYPPPRPHAAGAPRVSFDATRAIHDVNNAGRGRSATRIKAATSPPSTSSTKKSTK
jgi:hypothetical protein